MNKLYYTVYIGESISIEELNNDITYESLINSKDTLNNHVNKFYKGTIETFSGYGDKYANIKKTEIEVSNMTYCINVDMTLL
jgi:hypothetical protein